MAFSELFFKKREEWEATGNSGPCDQPKPDRWYFHVGAQWEGDMGCLRCGYDMEEHK